MTLEQQVCSLKLAKRLKELGVKQESLWWWASRMEGDEEASVLCDDRNWTRYYKDVFGWVRLSAFTVAELGEMLPNFIVFERTNEDNRWRCFSTKEVGTGSYPSLQWGDTEADARAKMLIYLLENKLV